MLEKSKGMLENVCGKTHFDSPEDAGNTLPTDTSPAQHSQRNRRPILSPEIVELEDVAHDGSQEGKGVPTVSRAPPSKDVAWWGAGRAKTAATARCLNCSSVQEKYEAPLPIFLPRLLNPKSTLPYFLTLMSVGTISFSLRTTTVLFSSSPRGGDRVISTSALLALGTMLRFCSVGEALGSTFPTSSE